jgi:2-dehydro-3-deoxy-D-arabinonate dehydratase
VKLYRTRRGIVAEDAGRAVVLDERDWDRLLNRRGLAGALRRAVRHGKRIRFDIAKISLLAPIVGQEVWAAGVTYFRSREARQLESAASGGGDFYARVYDAKRPELFLKATPHRVAAPRRPVHIRRDSHWNVPEPELAVAANARGEIIGWTVCNDMSSRDIEGANPLYLPQAKVYRDCCSIGPGLLIQSAPLPPDTEIEMRIVRGRQIVYHGTTSLDRMKRKPADLLDWLFRDNMFPAGVILSTGTGIVPPEKFTLRSGDAVHIAIDPIGTLSNTVARG